MKVYKGTPEFIKSKYGPLPDNWLPAEGIPEVLEYKKNLKGIEIGSCFGISTNYFMEMLDDSHVTVVDPYEDYDQMQNRNFALESMQHLISLYPDRLKLIRLKSDDAFDLFKNDSFDFIFIDGYHSNEQVAKDITNYYPKLKEGGLLCGHDYSAWNLHPSVSEAAGRYGKEIKICKNDVWYWFK